MQIKIAGLFMLFIMLTAQSSNADEKLYKWQNKDQSVNFSDVKPLILGAEKITIKTNISNEQAQKNLQEIIDRSNGKQPPEMVAEELTPEQKEQQEKIVNQNCETARKNMAMLQANARLVTENSDGTSKYWNDDERLSKIDSTQKQIDYYCK